MKLIRVTQSSPDWHDWRRTGVTASEVSCLFGKNPYKTEWRLWAEKTGVRQEEDIMGNPYVRRGKALEHMLREYVVDDLDVGIMPVCVEHDTIPYLKASLDGIDRHRRPWEFKVPSLGNYEEVRQHGENSDPAKQYSFQVQHQLLVTGADEGYLIFGKIDDSKAVAQVTDYILLVIKSDPALQRQIIEKSKEFMRRVIDQDQPAKDPDRDLFAPESQYDAMRWKDAGDKLIPLLAQKAALERKLEELKEQIDVESQPIIDVMGNNKYCEFSGLRATRCDRKGTVDWQAFHNDNGLVVDDNKVAAYRKADTKYYKFTAL